MCVCRSFLYFCWLYYTNSTGRNEACVGRTCGCTDVVIINPRVNLGFSNAEIYNKKNQIVNDGLESIRNLIYWQPPDNNLEPINDKESLKILLNKFSFLPLPEVTNLVNNLIISINDYNTLSLPVYVKNQLDEANIPTDIKIIHKEIKNTIKIYVIQTLRDSIIGDEVKTYTYKQLFDLLYYFLCLWFRLQFPVMIKVTTKNIIKNEV